jgi:hypothetical protein
VSHLMPIQSIRNALHNDKHRQGAAQHRCRWTPS